MARAPLQNFGLSRQGNLEVGHSLALHKLARFDLALLNLVPKQAGSR